MSPRDPGGAQHVFVVPPPRGGISGGNRYNEGLLAALERAGVPVEISSVAAAMKSLEAGAPGTYWIDSLFLDALPRLSRANRHNRPIGLLAHYLPSLVEHGEVPEPSALSATEAAALATADIFVAPSSFMADALRSLGALGRPVRVVEPGVELEVVFDKLGPPAGGSGGGDSDQVPRCEAVLVGNLVPGKGILPFLEALGAELSQVRGEHPLTVSIVGREDMEANYAAACRKKVERTPHLARAVRFRGPLDPVLLPAFLTLRDLFVSTSRMESFGLALAEARALGLPIVARAGGNVAAHVDPQAGGRLCADDRAVAAECLRLARSPRELAARRNAARATPPRQRTWAAAAQAFLAPVS